jgi:putative ABC transport system ATP-binding protein
MLQLDKIYVRDTLKNLCLTVKSSERVLIVGGNGSGKSTLFGVISGRIKPSSGNVILDNKNITNVAEYARTGDISSVLQDVKVGVIGEMTLMENIKLAYMRTGAKVVSNHDIDVFKEKLTVFGMNLENRLREYVKNLSGGEKQVLSVVMATSADYKLLLLDEVTSALNAKVSETIMLGIDRLTSIGKKTCLMITHDTKYINSFGDRTMEMENGALGLRH